MNVVPEQFDDGSGNEETFQTNKSKWHNTYLNLYSGFKLDRQKDVHQNQQCRI